MSLFGKQIDVCLYERVFPCNNKLTESCSNGVCFSDLTLANHVRGGARRGVMCHIGRFGEA